MLLSVGTPSPVPPPIRVIPSQVDEEYDGSTASRLLDMPHPSVDGSKLRGIAQLPLGDDTCLNSMWSFLPSWTAR
ncbi:hypothetical protein P3T23_003122 [Paraburkholderia sp. GAS448]